MGCRPLRVHFEHNFIPQRRLLIYGLNCWTCLLKSKTVRLFRTSEDQQDWSQILAVLDPA